jgi:hypothetical protein
MIEAERARQVHSVGGRAMKAKFSWAIAVLTIFGIVPLASAATVYVTYTGTVVDGSDQIGVFGPANSNLAGDFFTAAYVFNTSDGVTSQTTGPGGYQYNLAYGGELIQPAGYVPLSWRRSDYQRAEHIYKWKFLWTNFGNEFRSSERAIQSGQC